MTTYHEPPLHSRRAVRQDDAGETPPVIPSRPPAGLGEPLNYVTQNRPLLPGYGTPPVRGRRVAEPAQGTDEANADATQGEAPAYRFRDYSPDARPNRPAWLPDQDAPDGGVVDYHTQGRASVIPPAPVETPAPVEAPAAASLAAALGQPADLVQPPELVQPPNSVRPTDVTEHTLTRRELRALREAHGIVAVPTDSTPVVEEAAAPTSEAPIDGSSGGTALADPSPQLESALAEFDALASAQTPPRTGRRAAAVEPDQIPFSRTTPLEDEHHDAAPVADVPIIVELVTPTPEPMTAWPQAVEPQIPESQISESQISEPEISEPQISEFEISAPSTFEPGIAESEVSGPQTAEPASPSAFDLLFSPPVASPTGDRPIGHWTNQADVDEPVQVDDPVDVNEPQISRRVGSGAITTNALVLPSLPGQDISTGEILVTGSIGLPHSLSSTGAHPSQVDESDLDHLLDPGDQQVISTDSVPIRATRAVSSHVSTRGVIASTKPRGNRALTALIISAAGMAVVVATLLVVALATNVL